MVSTFALLGLVWGADGAFAGPLAQTARGVDHKSSSSSSSSGGSSDSNTVDHRDSDSSRDASGETSVLLAGDNTCYECEGGPELNLNLGPLSWETSFAAQKVRDSDGSFRFSTSLRFGHVGAYLAADHYFEHIEAKAAEGVMEENVRMNLVEVAPMVRMLDEETFSADLRLGFALATSTHFDSLPGGVLGLRLRARANDLLSLEVGGRAMAYQHDIVAFEGTAGLQYSIGYVGYRALKFDVGPVIEGPEAGLRFSF